MANKPNDYRVRKLVSNAKGARRRRDRDKEAGYVERIFQLGEGAIAEIDAIKKNNPDLADRGAVLAKIFNDNPLLLDEMNVGLLFNAGMMILKRNADPNASERGIILRLPVELIESIDRMKTTLAARHRGEVLMRVFAAFPHILGVDAHKKIFRLDGFSKEGSSATGNA